MDYKFDAFISYRHCDLDKFVAENLHKLLETYKPPKSALKKSGRKSIKRVFRDQEELPLTSNLEEPIIDALKQSEYLIVICSPRLKDSAWCRKEIETFISLNGREKVLAVLIEGEPNESFPEEILKGEEKTIYENGIPKIVYERKEPLAADFRGKNKNEIKKKMKFEVLRLMAPMYNVDFDDLRQRHKERKLHNIIRTSILFSILAFLFGVYCATTALQIKKQNIEIKEQSDQITEQANQIKAQSDKIEKQNEELKYSQAKSLTDQAISYYNNDERLDSINYSIMALTNYNGVDMPFIPEAQYSLTLSSRIYSGDCEFAPTADVKMPSLITDFKISSDGKRCIVYDNGGNINVYSLIDLKKLYGATTDVDFELHPDYFGFINNDTIYYVSGKIDQQIRIVDVNIGEEKCVINLEGDNTYANVSRIAISPEEKELAVAYEGNEDSLNIHIYDTQSYKEIGSYSCDDCNAVKSLDFINEDKLVFSKYEKIAFSVEGSDVNFVVYDINKDEEIFTFDDNLSSVDDLCYSDNTLYYICTNHTNVLSTNSSINAYDLNSGNKLWSRTIDGVSFKSIVLSDKYMFLSLSKAAKILDRSNGDEVMSCETSSEILEPYFLNDRFYFLEADGCMGIITLENRNFFEMGYINCTRLSKIQDSINGYVGVPEKSQNLCLYNKEINEAKIEFSDDYIEPSENNIVYDEDKYKILDDIHISNQSLVKYVYSYEDIGIYIIQYYNEMHEVYDMKTKNKLGEFEVYVSSLNLYFGRDIYGNYIFGDYNAIILNENFQLVGVLPSLAGISLDKKNYIQYDYLNDEKVLYSIPVYSLDEMIKYGKDKLVEYNH